MRQLFFLIGFLLPTFSFSQTKNVTNDSVISVRDNGLVANFYLPKTSGKHPAIIVIGGSEGGIWLADAWGEPLSTRGYAVLSLAYFGMEKLPTQLEEIPLEYFKKAIDWVSAHPSVDSKQIAFAGVSKGGEAALLIAAIYPEVKAVVAGVPSHVVWQSINWQSLNKKEKPTTKSSWTLQGKALPFVPYDTSQKFTSLLDFYVGNLRDQRAVEAAIIPVEKIKGPVLLISGKDDKMWPSTLMAEQVVDRLKKKKFRFSYEHLSYDNAGHAITGPPRKSSPVSVTPAVDTSSSPRPIWQMGGTPEGNTLARNDAWAKILKFLDRSLHVGQKNPAAKDKNSGSSIEKELIALEHKWNAAFWRRDIKALDSIIADDIIITYGNGKMANKQEELASFETGIDSSLLDDFKVRLYEEVAVVMYRLTAKGPKFDTSNNQFRYTDVFVKRDGRWQCVVSHNTRVEKH